MLAPGLGGAWKNRGRSLASSVGPRGAAPQAQTKQTDRPAMLPELFMDLHLYRGQAPLLG